MLLLWYQRAESAKYDTADIQPWAALRLGPEINIEHRICTLTFALSTFTLAYFIYCAAEFWAPYCRPSHSLLLS